MRRYCDLVNLKSMHTFEPFPPIFQDWLVYCDLILNTIHFKITGILQILTNSAIFFDEILQTLLALVDSDEIALDVSENGAKHCKHSEKPTKKLD